MTELIFFIHPAASGRSICRNCNQFIAKKTLRIGKNVPNPCDVEDEGWGDMTLYYHVPCMFKEFDREKAKERKIKSPDDMGGFDQLKQDEKETVLRLISDANIKREDNSLHQFRCLCTKISEEDSNTGKTALVSDYLKKGTSGTGFKGDVYMLMKFLLTGVVKTKYNLNNADLVKFFSEIFGTSQKAMEEDLEQTEVWEIIRVCFEKSKTVTPLGESIVSLREMDGLLTALSTATQPIRILKKIIKRCTSYDLKMMIRLIKHDIGINSKAKYILDGLDPNAYEAFQISEDLKDVVDRVQSKTLQDLPGMKMKTGNDTESDGASSSTDLKKTPVKRQAEDEGQTTPSKKSKPDG
ncbi:DNA ligase 3-like [Haliotis rubra]|uniref:DNA ligase 3-like n=1 Tax=Haliotis rubra TaxID=36100 RepID=UPI001EE534CD|nr:DNA ligase 3-like [Haliotis rubra]XP_046572188.1 DNA ligase 3-like [Haliotis rubra]